MVFTENPDEDSFLNLINRLSHTKEYDEWNHEEIQEFKNLKLLQDGILQQSSECTGTLYDLLAWKNIFYDIYVEKDFRKVTNALVQDFVIIVSRLYRRHMNLHSMHSRLYYLVFSNYAPPEKERQPQSRPSSSVNRIAAAFVDTLKSKVEERKVKTALDIKANVLETALETGNTKFNYFAYRLLLRYYTEASAKVKELKAKEEAHENSIKELTAANIDLRKKYEAECEETKYLKERILQLEHTQYDIVNKIGDSLVKGEQAKKDSAVIDKQVNNVFKNQMSTRFNEHIDLCKKKLSTFSQMFSDLVQSNESSSTVSSDAQHQLQTMQIQVLRLMERFDTIKDDIGDIAAEIGDQLNEKIERSLRDKQQWQIWKQEQKQFALAQQAMSRLRERVNDMRTHLANYINEDGNPPMTEEMAISQEHATDMKKHMDEVNRLVKHVQKLMGLKLQAATDVAALSIGDSKPSSRKQSRKSSRGSPTRKKTPSYAEPLSLGGDAENNEKYDQSTNTSKPSSKQSVKPNSRPSSKPIVQGSNEVANMLPITGWNNLELPKDPTFMNSLNAEDATKVTDSLDLEATTRSEPLQFGNKDGDGFAYSMPKEPIKKPQYREDDEETLTPTYTARKSRKQQELIDVASQDLQRVFNMQSQLVQSQQFKEEQIKIKSQFNSKLQFMKDVYDQRIQDIEIQLREFKKKYNELIKRAVPDAYYTKRAPLERKASIITRNSSFRSSNIYKAPTYHGVIEDVPEPPKPSNDEYIVISDQQVNVWEKRKERILAEHRKKLEASMSQIRTLDADYYNTLKDAGEIPSEVGIPDQYAYQDEESLLNGTLNGKSMNSLPKITDLFKPDNNGEPAKLPAIMNPSYSARKRSVNIVTPDAISSAKRMIYSNALNNAIATMQNSSSSRKHFVSNINLFEQIERQLSDEERRFQVSNPFLARRESVPSLLSKLEA